MPSDGDLEGGMIGDRLGEGLGGVLENLNEMGIFFVDFGVNFELVEGEER